jgi:tRNA pseudouridine-54 N-methylase
LFLVLLPAAAFIVLLPPTVKAGPRRRAARTTCITRQRTAVALLATTHHQRNILVLSHNVSQDVADGLFGINDLLHGRVDVLARCVNSALWVSNGIRHDTSVFLMLFPHNITIEIQGCAVRGLNPDERTMALALQRTLLVGRRESGRLGDNEEDGSSEVSVEGQQVERDRLRATNRQRPETINPFKPGALPKSERARLRIVRKQREAMVRRIDRAAKLGDDTPIGFVLHQKDSLEARLEQFSRMGPLLMFDELGEQLSDELLDHIYQSDRTEKTTGTSATTNTTMTLILGDQIGYSAGDVKCLAENKGVRQISLGPLSLLTSQCITISHHYLDLYAAAAAASRA